MIRPDVAVQLREGVGHVPFDEVDAGAGEVDGCAARVGGPLSANENLKPAAKVLAELSGNAVFWGHERRLEQTVDWCG